MPLANRVRETSNTSGASQTLALNGAPTGFQSFVAGIGTGNQCYAVIVDTAGAWEIRRGTVTDASPDTLSFLELINSSTGSAINFGTDTKVVVCIAPANKQLFIDTDNNVKPDVTGRGLGTTGLRWNAFLTDLNASGNATITGTLAVNGNTTLGDASGDTTTINGTAVTIPNGLNFDANTFVIDAANNRVGIGVAAPLQLLDLGTSSVARLNNIQRPDNAGVAFQFGSGTNTAYGAFVLRDGSGANIRAQMTDPGAWTFPAVGTTAAAANAVLDNAASNNFLRSTSSRRYKRDIEPLSPAVAEAVWQGFAPVFYRSTSQADNGLWSWYGAIAEDLAALDPRLVHWTRLHKQQPRTVVETVTELRRFTLREPEVVEIERDGETIRATIPGEYEDREVEVPRERIEIDIVPDAEAVAALPANTPGWTDDDGFRWVPDGAQYERLALVALAGARAQIAALEARIAALEAR